ncbi:hypothetical protein EMMF5_000502 [Cystobasidiomycetes sp. EMM_F5]
MGTKYEPRELVERFHKSGDVADIDEAARLLGEQIERASRNDIKRLPEILAFIEDIVVEDYVNDLEVCS